MRRWRRSSWRRRGPGAPGSTRPSRRVRDRWSSRLTRRLQPGTRRIRRSSSGAPSPASRAAGRQTGYLEHLADRETGRWGSALACASPAAATRSAASTARRRADLGVRLPRPRHRPRHERRAPSDVPRRAMAALFDRTSTEAGGVRRRPVGVGGVKAIPDEELWAARCAARGRLVRFAAAKAVSDRLLRGEDTRYAKAAAGLDSDALTLGCHPSHLRPTSDSTCSSPTPKCWGGVPERRAALPAADRREGPPSRRGGKTRPPAPLQVPRRARRRPDDLPGGLRPRHRARAASPAATSGSTCHSRRSRPAGRAA